MNRVFRNIAKDVGNRWQNLGKILENHAGMVDYAGTDRAIIVGFTIFMVMKCTSQNE
jgi:hypothetical protein